MKPTGKIRALVIGIFRRKRIESEMSDEIEFHVEARAEDLMKRTGLSRKESQRQARLEFGSVDKYKEEGREARGLRLFDELRSDLRYATRQLRNSPTFTAMAVLSLALGIGANTAIFSFMDAILIRSLPVSHPESLVTLAYHAQRGDIAGMNLHDDSSYDPHTGLIGGVFAYPAFEMFQKNSSILSSVFGYQGTGDLTLTAKGTAGNATGEYVSGEYFNGLGVGPAAGRLVSLDDDHAGAAAVAVMSYRWADAHFATPEAAVGQRILIDNIPFSIVGVVPPEFFGADPAATPDVYVPMHTSLLLHAAIPYAPDEEEYLSPRFDWVDVMARLRPGVNSVQAQAALTADYENWQREVAKTRSRPEIATVLVKDGRSGLDSLRREYSTPLYILFALVVLILTIACANLANLMLARTASRRREIAVRLSIGAGRLRLIRQLLTESVLLAIISGILGIGFANWGVRVLTLLLANGRDNFTLHAEVNGHVLAATAALSAVVGLLFGLAPAIQSTRLDLTSSLKELGSVGRRRRFRIPLTLSRSLIVAQIGIAVLILVTTGLFVRTVSTLESIQLGFNRENLLTFRIDAKQTGHKDAELVSFYKDLQSRLAAIPGVRGVSLSTLPLIGMGSSGAGVQVVGDVQKSSRILPVGAGFFSTMQIPILSGRAIDERDQPGAPLVAVVNQAFAKNNVGAPDPVGRHVIGPGECGHCDIEIIGLATDAHYGNIRNAVLPTMYVPFTEGIFSPFHGMTYELRTVGNPIGVAGAALDIARRIDPQLPLTNIKTQSDLIDETINSQIMFSRLCSAFAILALTIATVGLYGTMSYKVARRTSEIGIRMALGAERVQVIWMILREVLVLLLVGIGISIPIALVTTKAVSSLLYGVKPTDPISLAAAVLTLVIAALLAGYLPARNASRIDPLIALRHE